MQWGKTVKFFKKFSKCRQKQIHNIYVKSRECILFLYLHILYMENKAILTENSEKISICYPFVTKCKIFNFFTNIHRNPRVLFLKKSKKTLFLTDIDIYDCIN